MQAILDQYTLGPYPRKKMLGSEYSSLLHESINYTSKKFCNTEVGTSATKHFTAVIITTLIIEVPIQLSEIMFCGLAKQ